MKKIKNLVLMLIVALCSFVVVESKVNASFSISNSTLICEPGGDASNSLEKGDSANCYLVGNATSTLDVAHGFVTRLYTTDGLRFVNAVSFPSGTTQLIVDPTSQSADKVQSADGVVTNFICPPEVKDATNSQYPLKDGDDYRCVVLYTPSKEGKGLFSAANGTTSDDKTAETEFKNVINENGKLGFLNPVALVKIVVKLDEEAEGNGCGEICIKAWAVPTVDLYGDSKYTSPDSGSESGTGGGYICREVHYDTGGELATPDTGAFASYALLAIGALIAISAVAVAQKHNKIYKI